MWDVVMVRAGRIAIVAAAILAVAAGLVATAGSPSDVSSVNRAVLATSAPTAGSRVHFKVVPSVGPTGPTTTHTAAPTGPTTPPTHQPTKTVPTAGPTRTGPLAATGNGPVVDWLAGAGAVLLVGGVVLLLIARERRAARRRTAPPA
jgi:hypothetical protein